MYNGSAPIETVRAAPNEIVFLEGFEEFCEVAGGSIGVFKVFVILNGGGPPVGSFAPEAGDNVVDGGIVVPIVADAAGLDLPNKLFRGKTFFVVFRSEAGKIQGRCDREFLVELLKAIHDFPTRHDEGNVNLVVGVRYKGSGVVGKWW